MVWKGMQAFPRNNWTFEAQEIKIVRCCWYWWPCPDILTLCIKVFRNALTSKNSHSLGLGSKKSKKQWLWKHNNWNLQAFILNWSQPRNVPPWSHHRIPMGKRGLVAQNGYHVRGRKFLIDVLQRFVKVVLWIAWLSRRPRAAVCHAFYLSLSGHPWIAGLRSAI